MKLNEMMSVASLMKEIGEGFVRPTRHPTQPLTILNYTERAQFTRRWNDVTLACRGLIIDDDYSVVARPFPKFFNYGENGAARISMDEPVTVTDKMDGSLGIMYLDRDGEFRIATRGSFTSEQAIHANDVLKAKYPDFWVSSEWTLLFEIVYPENRIVVNYGAQDDLFLLGAVHKKSGRVVGPEAVPGWPGPRTEILTYNTLREAVSAPVRPGKEGVVVRALHSSRAMVKIKQPEYVELHRIVTGLNPKGVWQLAMDIDLAHQYISTTDLVQKIVEGIPDEMHGWVTGQATLMSSTVKSQLAETQDLVVMNRNPSGMISNNERKEFALKIKDRPRWQQTAAWLLYDGKDPREFLWKQLKPKEEK